MKENSSTLISVNNRLESIDSLRGWACIGIVIFHAQAISNLAVPTMTLSFLSHLALGVPLFFVLSSFSILYSLKNTVLSQDAIRKYMLRRYFRIAPLYYFMIFIYIIDRLLVGAPLYSFKELFLNFTFSFSFSPIFHEGIVWAGWSIGIEFIMYLLLPVLLSMAVNLRVAFFLFIITLIIGIILSHQYVTEHFGNDSYTYKNIIIMLPFFGLGILLYMVFKQSIFSKLKLYHWVILNILLISCLVYFSEIVNSGNLFLKKLEVHRIPFYAWTLFFSSIILMQLYTPLKILNNKLFIFLGKISFSIYLIHPFLISKLTWLYKYVYSYVLNDSFSFIVSLTFTFILLIPISYLTYLYIELPGINFGKRKISKLEFNSAESNQ